MIHSLLMTTQTVDRAHPVLGFTHEWIATLARRVTRLHVLTPVKGETDLPDNVTIHHLTTPGQFIPTTANHLMHHRVFWQLVLSQQVNGVFVHMIPKWAIAASPYCRLGAVPLMLWYAHGHVSPTLRVAERLVNAIVTSTPEGCRLDSAKVSVVGQGIDTAHFVPGEGAGNNDSFKIITVGRLSPVKNLENTIEVMRILVHEHHLTNVRLDLVGGPLRPGDEVYVRRLQHQVAECSLADHVRFVGIKTYDTIVPVYQDADLLLNLSQTNSLDKVALEAMACGTPVLTSNPAFKAMLTDIDAAFYLDHPAAEETAVALKTVMAQTAAERTKLGKALRKAVVQHHGIDQLANNLLETLEKNR